MGCCVAVTLQDDGGVSERFLKHKLGLHGVSERLVPRLHLSCALASSALNKKLRYYPWNQSSSVNH